MDCTGNPDLSPMALSSTDFGMVGFGSVDLDTVGLDPSDIRYFDTGSFSVEWEHILDSHFVLSKNFGLGIDFDRNFDRYFDRDFDHNFDRDFERYFDRYIDHNCDRNFDRCIDTD